MSSSEIVTIALAVIFLLFMFIGLIFTFGTKKARAKYGEQNNRRKEFLKEKKAAGQTGIKYQASVIKKQFEDGQERRAEDKAERARKFETAKSNLKSEVLNYLDNPSTNSMRYRNDLLALWEKNGFSLTWEVQELKEVDTIRAGIVLPIKIETEFVFVTVDKELTLEELQYPTEEVMNRQWKK
jgi:hypothetical protein